MKELKKQLQELYLDYINNYLLIETIAEKEEINASDMKELLKIGKKLNNKEYIY